MSAIIAPPTATLEDGATAPAAAVEASPAAETPRVGFLARLVGAESTIMDLQSRLETQSAAHAATSAALATAQARIAEFEALEAQLEAQAATATAAAAAATAVAASVPAQVAAAVADVVATLGVDESTLAPIQSEPPAKGQEFSHLKGLERAAAAINARYQS